MRAKRPGFTKQQLHEAVAASLTYTDALRRLGMRPAGGNYGTLKKYIRLWSVSVTHFDPNASRRRASTRRARPLDEILVENSAFSRGHLKERLYAEGLKARRCEICGQDENWHGRQISLILDHINGVGTDNRLENLRIVCPNCAASLPTHCGRNVKMIDPRTCARCGESFRARLVGQRHCSKACGLRSPRSREPRPEARKAVRPPIRHLLCEIGESSYREVGRRYGVSDNAIRKWLRAEGVTPPRVCRPRGG